MANYIGVKAAHATLGASTVDTVTLTATNGKLTLLNRSGAAEIYFTISIDGTAPSPPTVLGTDCFVLPAAIGSVEIPVSGEPTIVKLISTGTPTYSVEVL